MAKFTCANIPGRYEGSGIEVSVFPTQIVVVTRGEEKKVIERKPTETRKDDGNMSLLSSISTIADRIKKR